MQISVETISGLERKVIVSLPAERYSQAFAQRLKKAARTAKIDGFRPGKAPEQLIASRYGDSLKEEALSEMINTSFYEVLKQEQLNPASQPHFTPSEAVLGQPIEYTATFEIYPTIELVNLDNVTIEKLVADVTDADIDKVIDNLRKQKTVWHTVDRVAKVDDKLIIDFKGIMDGEPLENGSAEDAEIVLGAKTMIPGFEDGLLGAKAGDERVLTLQFPEDYHVKTIAGKPVEFTVKVKQVQEGVLPAVDEQLAEDFNIKGGVSGLKQEVRHTLERNLQQVLANRLKSEVLDRLNELNPIEVPKALVANESRQMMMQLLNQMRSGSFNRQMPDVSPEALQEQAQRRVKLSLLLAEAVKKFEIKLDNQKVQDEINRIAASYENPQEVITWYNNDKEQLTQIEAAVMEDQIIEALLTQAQVVEKTATYDEAMNSK